MAILGLDVSRVLPFNIADSARLLAALPSDCGVYIIRHQKYGTTDENVVYVGRAGGFGGLRQRIQQYFAPGPSQWTNRRVLRKITELDGHELFFRVLPTAWDAATVEWRLLRTYQSTYGHLPSYNIQMPPQPAASREVQHGRWTTSIFAIVSQGQRQVSRSGALRLPAMATDGTKVIFWGTPLDTWNIAKIEESQPPFAVRCLCESTHSDGSPAVWVPQHSPLEMLSVDEVAMTAEDAEWHSLSSLADRAPVGSAEPESGWDEVDEFLRAEADDAVARATLFDDDFDDEDGESLYETEMDDYDEDGAEIDPKRGNEE